MQSVERQLQARDKGTPQGGVVSPILANLFLHYAFDLWVTRHPPGVRFARYTQEAGGLQNKGRRNAQKAGYEPAMRVRPLVDRLSVVGWMMGAG